MKLSTGQRIVAAVKKPFIAIRHRVTVFLKRRPHRSFRLTRRRDYRRALQMPGLLAFTHIVNRTLWRFRKMFILLIVVYGLLTAVLVGLGSQDTYTSLTESLRGSGEQLVEGDASALGNAGLVFVSIATSGLTEQLSESQQIFSVMIGLLIWLTTVWLLRSVLAGHKAKLRDGLYNAGAPLVPTFLLTIVLVIQLLPVAVAAIGYGAAASSGLLSGGIEAALFWTAAGLLALLSLYWITSTLFALVIATLPGMYPLRALSAAGDLILGRRVRVMIRIVWMVLCVVVGWAAILIPFILLDAWVKGMWPQLEWLPLIPVILVVVTSFSVVWAATYIYMLYRKVVESGDNESDR